MSHGVGIAQPVKHEAAWKRFFSPANRYLSPLLISCVLLVGQLSYGILESNTRTLLAIGTSLIAELVRSRIYMGKWPTLARAGDRDQPHPVVASLAHLYGQVA